MSLASDISVGHHRRAWPWLAALLLLAVLFRFPPMLNAAAVNSDAAVVGLQAQHILAGEWSWFLWGTRYQGTFEPLLAAGLFAMLGAKPWVLFAVPLLELLAMVGLAFDLLRRRVGNATAAALVLPLVFAPHAATSPMIYVMRQGLATAAVFAVWLFERGAPRSTPAARFFLAASVMGLCLYIDLFALVILPPLALYGLLWLVERPFRWGPALGRLLAAAVGLAVGLIPYWVARSHLLQASAEASIALARFPANLRLLWNTCLPFALGTKVFVQGNELYPDVWQTPWPVTVLQVLGALIFVITLASGGLAVFSRRIPFAIRRLGLLGFSATLCTVAAFLLSSMPVDMWSTRYLAPMFWTAPFALAPVGWLLQEAWLTVGLSPYFASAILGGWLSWGRFVDGPLPRLDARGAARDERELKARLGDLGVEAASAHYWLAYRLSFLFQEDPVVVPLSPGDDRYPPYRQRFNSARTVAYLFHPSEPRGAIGPFQNQLKAEGTVFERLEVAGFSVLLVKR